MSVGMEGLGGFDLLHLDVDHLADLEILDILVLEVFDDEMLKRAPIHRVSPEQRENPDLDILSPGEHVGSPPVEGPNRS